MAEQITLPEPSPRPTSERYEMPSDAVNIAVDGIHFFESDRGKVKREEKIGKTFGEYHVRETSLTQYGIEADRSKISEKEQAIGISKGIVRELQDDGVDFNALTPNEQAATIMYLYNAGSKQKKFRNALSKLAKARKSNSNDIDKYREMAAGFIDVYLAGGKYNPGLASRRLIEQQLFLNNKTNYKEMRSNFNKLSDSELRKKVRNGRNNSDNFLRNQNSKKLLEPEFLPGTTYP